MGEKFTDAMGVGLPFAAQMNAQSMQRQQRACTRELRIITEKQGVYIHYSGQRFLDFSSNDYLGLSQHPEVVAAMQTALSRHGVGAAASQAISGHYQLHAQLAQAIADWLGYDRGLVFGNGYLANLAVQQAFLTGSNDICVQDRLNHASLIDASRLAGCRLRRYKHADIASARHVLSQLSGKAVMLVTDGVFSIDGDIAPLPDLCHLAQYANALVYVDDAHGFGVIGRDGRGSVITHQLNSKHVPLQLVTLGKAFGVYGAVVVGTADYIEHLAQTARSHLYSTALPPALVAAAMASLQRVKQDDWRRERLQYSIALFRELAQRRGISLTHSTTAIQGIICEENQKALDWSSALEHQGFFVRAIRPPTVPQGTARLRITLSTAHAELHIRSLIDALSGLLDSTKAGG